MSLKTFVKIGKINNLSDARYCAGMMVDILGFNLQEGTEGYVDPSTFKEISDWVAGVSFCGEFVNALPAEIKLATTNYPIDFVEVQDVTILEELSEVDVQIIFKYLVEDKASLSQLAAQLELAAEHAAYIIVSSTKPEFSNEIQQKLTEIDLDVPVLRGYDLSVANTPAIAEDEVFGGIELEGSPEDRPGYKDYGLVMDILEVLDED
ncbi:hypothetical protein [Marinoscillum sp.]|uniref:hypothetical protein n=1 Tax=Marinoscillum sp. TaxID=2024838 RepID=UPI003BAB65B1